jgi:hypothetical protein
MTMLVEHGATVLPFTDALLRRPKKQPLRRVEPSEAPSAELPDNVILLAGFARRSRRAHQRHWLGGPPGGEAA